MWDYLICQWLQYANFDILIDVAILILCSHVCTCCAIIDISNGQNPPPSYMLAIHTSDVPQWHVVYLFPLSNWHFATNVKQELNLTMCVCCEMAEGNSRLHRH